VGIADRSAYDLQVHARATKTELVAREALPEPVEVAVLRLVPNRKELGKVFKADQVRSVGRGRGAPQEVT
jgi:glycyl-tRNA synthetase